MLHLGKHCIALIDVNKIFSLNENHDGSHVKMRGPDQGLGPKEA